MKAYKMELLVLDFQDSEEDDVKYLIESNKYLTINILSTKSKQIDDWDDDNPLNNTDTQKDEIDRIFSY